MHLRGARHRAASCGSRLPPAAECQRGSRATASAHPASSPAPLSPRPRSPGLPLPAGPPPLIPPSPCRRQGLAILGAAGSGGRHVGGHRGGSAIAGCRALTMALSRVAARLCRPGRRRAPALRYRLRLRRARLPARGPGPAPGKEGAGGRCLPLRAKGTEAAGSPQPAAGFVPSANKALHLL